MRRQYAYLLLVPVLCMSLLGFASSAQAQTLAPTPTGAAESTPAPTQVPGTAALVAENMVTFNQINQSDINLIGPYDRIFFTFSLPSDWKLKEGAELDLSIGVSITRTVVGVTDPNNPGQTTAPESVITGGTLTVQLNGITLQVIPLTQSGELPTKIQIPLSTLLAVRPDGRFMLGLTLNSDTSCAVYSDQLDVTIRNGSSFTLPHDLVMPDTSLANFPRPIIQGSFIPDTALFVLPDQPTAVDLQAALTLASGLGNLSGTGLITDVTTVSNLTPLQKSAGHLIMVGKGSALPLLGQLNLPISPSGGQFKMNSTSSDDGLVQMVNSPWNKSAVILVVSGNTDKGLIKAAQAVTTGFLRPNAKPNLSIVDQVQTTASTSVLPVDQTLADLGYSMRTFESRGLNSATYRFNVPPGWVVSQDANFKLFFGNSRLLNYDLSGLVVLLNNQPIGSVRFSDATADKASNLAQIMIPPSLVLPGPNIIEVRVSLESLHRCTPRTLRGMYATIWPESNLHVPISQSPVLQVLMDNLAAYPAPFIFSPSLSTTAFVLPHNDLQSWNSALQIAAQLGNNANGAISMPMAFYADQVPVEERAKYNLLVIGRPSQLPLITEINESLPAPFETGTDTATEKSFQVTYRIPADSPSGYVQLLASPWNPDKVILAVLGKQADGLSWAVSTLTTSAMRTQLAGNFAVAVNSQLVKSTDTRIIPITVGAISTEVPSNTQLIQQGTTTQAPVNQNSWVLPVLGISVVLLIVLVVALFATGNKPRGTRSE